MTHLFGRLPNDKAYIHRRGSIRDFEGLPRIEQRLDGLYVLGRGHLIPVKDMAEAEHELKELSKLNR